MNSISRVCRMAEFDEEWFRDRTHEMAHSHFYHRKLWEFCAITQALLEGEAKRGERAIGFGCGREPIASWLAAHGLQVLVTDRPDTTVQWSDTNQHASGLGDAWHPLIVDYPTFYRLASFRPVDMNAIPEDLHGQFDYTWSAGSFEHIGSFDASIRFFCEQMKCLRPGGVAAHTTEYNPDPLRPTLESRDLVLFRQPEIERLEEALAAQGDYLMPVCYTRDYHEVVGPTGMPHINLGIMGWVTTSILLVAVRGAR